jgi:hypothetical protein
MNIQDLHKNLQKEWYYINEFFSRKTKTESWEDFKKNYENFESISIQEFLTISDKTFELWEHWKYINNYSVDFVKQYNSKNNHICKCYIRNKPNEICDHSIKNQTFSEVWGSFKEYLNYDNPETKIALKDMELLSETMFGEWVKKLGIRGYDYYGSSDNKSFIELWNEFKEIWGINPDDYNEDELNEMLYTISNTYCEEFQEYLTDMNYHSYKWYSIGEQYEICMHWSGII